ncbi:MAG: hypothetical protein JXB49_01755 [Bacteroidales bacterium]|nr:hypothetical protein [Bacteroidales bacterium]
MKALFFGLNVIDIQYLIETGIQQNKKYRAKEVELSIGGPAVNAAITFTVLGGDASYAGFINGHMFSHWIENELQTYKVICCDLSGKIPAVPVFSSIISSMNNGDRTIVYNPPEEHDGVIEADLLHDIELVLLDGFFIESAIKVAKLAKTSNIPVVLDGGSWKYGMDNLLPYIDIAICSENFITPYTTSIHNTIDMLISRGIQNVAFTRGGDPIVYTEMNTFNQFNVNKIEVIDTLGAGDIFHGAFCYFFLKHKNFIEALREASYIASYSCQFKGTREWIKYYDK